MTLRPAEGQPGLWVNDDWDEGYAGTFAVVIGVSRYDHLAGSAAPANDTYDLGQLYVSALTAYRFFRWLGDTYRFGGSPIAKVWLLLAPTHDELANVPGLADVAARSVNPNFQACSSAIGAWYGAMAALPLQSQQQSRSFFFFSGHGIEREQQRQILLPSDYLAPPVANVNMAIGTQNVTSGMAALSVPRQFYCLDACRNDHARLNSVRLEGTPILNEPPSYSANRKLVSPILYGSVSGSQAWQPEDPLDGPSLYGQALVEGLCAQAGLEPDCSSVPCAVNLYALQTFMNTRVTALIESRGSTVEQRIPLGGTSFDVPLTEVSPVVPASAQPAPPSLAIARASRLTEQYSVSEDRFVRSAAPGGVPLVNPFSHPAYGSEQVTDTWQTALVQSLDHQARLSVPTPPTVHHVERDSASLAFQVTLSAPASAGGHWLTLSYGSQQAGILLSADPFGSTRYLIEMTREPNPGLTRLDAFLAPDNTGLPGIAARLWQQYYDVNVGEAVKAFDPKLAEEALDRLQSPTSALVAGIILLRAGSWDILQDWLRDLALRFPALPDGGILWAEQLLQQHGDDPLRVAEALGWLLHLDEVGLPRTSEALSYAMRQARELPRLLALSPAQWQRLNAVKVRLEEAGRYFRPGGLFTVFMSDGDNLTPAVFFGLDPTVGVP